MTEHGKIHTDGSRSGGQPVSDNTAVLTEKLGAILAQLDEVVMTDTDRARVVIENYERLRQPTPDAMRQIVDELECALNAPTWDLAMHHVHDALAALQQSGPPVSSDAMVADDTPAISEAMATLLVGRHILRVWRCVDGGYMVVIGPTDYWAPSIKEVLDKATAALQEKQS